MRIFDQEYQSQCFNIYEKGGILYLIERIDTHEFLYKELKAFQSNKPSTYHDSYKWNKNISYFTVFFLTQEDAQNFLKIVEMKEGGCHCCGHGKTDIAIQVTEHEFIY